MGWCSDPGSGGTRFDSRHAQVILGSLFGHVGVTVGDFGRCCDVFGSGLGMFSDGFGRVLEKMSEEVKKY